MNIEPAPIPPLLPFSRWWPLVAGVLAGLALRLLFSGKPGSPYATMLGAFVYLGPVVVGAVTVYAAERTERRTWSYYLWAPFVANVFFVLGTLLIMVEGREIHQARSIRPDEVDAAWFFRIGVPLPQAGISQDTPSGRVRSITMGKSVHFEQVVTEWEENRHVRWAHRYAPDSFPAHALDDHVVLGGHYFDVDSSAYWLTPTAQGTELRVRMTYRVSTPFNWYADPIARSMLENFEGVLLRFYERRSTRG
jgi:hypothetical protein